VGTSALFAHDDYRIIGVVERVTAKTIDVKQTKDGKVISMQLDADTIVTRDKRKVDRAEVKVGLHVVVDARGDSLDELTVVELRLVPAPTAQ
jgi:hypothetical protein